MDGMFAGLELSPADQEKLNRKLMELQIQESQRNFNTASEKCFTNCVKGFHNRALDKQEMECIAKCTEKFLKFVTRSGLRMAEQNALMQQQAQQQQAAGQLR